MLSFWKKNAQQCPPQFLWRGRHFGTCESLGSSIVKMSQAFYDPSIYFNLLYRRVNTFKTPEMCLYLDSDIAPDVYNYFSGIIHYFELVSCWILFCENVADVPRPFDQLPSQKKGPTRCFVSSRDWSLLRFVRYLLWFHLASVWSWGNKHSRNFRWCSRFYWKDCNL